MTDAQINAAIAEHCGVGCSCEWRPCRCTPNYCGDLNAMHEAEAHMDSDGRGLGEYGERLREMAKCVGPRGGPFVPNCFGIFAIAHLTARRRAVAFLSAVDAATQEAGQ